MWYSEEGPGQAAAPSLQYQYYNSAPINFIIFAVALESQLQELSNRSRVSCAYNTSMATKPIVKP